MKKLDKLCFLIHGFCYAEMERDRQRPITEVHRPRYLERERQCADRWRARLCGLLKSEALAIIPWSGAPGGPSADYSDLAQTALGERCFLLDCPDAREETYWSGACGDGAAGAADELRSALVGQGDCWNKEELLTALHARACCDRLSAMLSERGFVLDETSLPAEAWGASFEGCVTKYTLNFRRLLGLSHVIQIRPEMTVLDTLFLLDAVGSETMLLENGLRLYLFRLPNRWVALYTLTAHSLEGGAVYARLAVDPDQVTVLSKQGIRLWSDPEPYHLPDAPAGCYEPPTQVVRFEYGRLCVPVSAGYVYRLAKAPAYIFAAPGTTRASFLDVLTHAEFE